MDAFEQIVAGLFRQQGYWTWQGYKVDITREEKREIGKPSMPRPEIDILAYRPLENALLWIECKSYLDSFGVKMTSFEVEDGSPSHYKVFTNSKYREVVTARLLQQVVERGLAYQGVALQYCLVAGNIHQKTSTDVAAYFKSKGWQLYDKIWIKDQLKKLSNLSYENDIAIIVAKLFERE
jgi:hypothetical protein